MTNKDISNKIFEETGCFSNDLSMISQFSWWRCRASGDCREYISIIGVAQYGKMVYSRRARRFVVIDAPLGGVFN